MNSSEIEFSESENTVFRDVSNRMKIFGYLLIANSILSLILLVFQSLMQGSAVIGAIWLALVFSGIGTVIYIAIALYTLKASSSLRDVADTEGQDVPHLMTAMNSLKTLYGIQYWLIVISILAAILIMIGVFTYAALAPR